MPPVKTSEFQLSPTGGQPSSDTCIANIGGAERSRRLRFGIITFLFASVILLVLVLTGQDRWFRLPLGLLFAAAAGGYFQWADKTCVALTKKGVRNMGEHEEVVNNASEMAQLKWQANRVQIKAAIAGLVATVIIMLLPVMG